MAKKGNSELFKLRNPETGTFYVMRKNTKSQNEKVKAKMSFKKYDKKTRKHELFVEAKI